EWKKRLLSQSNCKLSPQPHLSNKPHSKFLLLSRNPQPSTAFKLPSRNTLNPASLSNTPPKTSRFCETLPSSSNVSSRNSSQLSRASIPALPSNTNPSVSSFNKQLNSTPASSVFNA